MAGTKIPKNIGWNVTALIVTLVIILPILFVLLYTLEMESWPRSGQLSIYITNTSILLGGVSIVTLTFGVATAWIVTVFDFPFRKTLDWLLILPLAIPTFINAIAYVGLLDYAGPVRIFLRSIAQDSYFDIMNHTGAIFVMSLVLYPYIYVGSRTAFIMQSASLIEVSRSLGKSLVSTFFRLSLPLAWPAIFGGLILVIMEVLNDYGVVQYFGIPTLTIGIFRSWLALGDFPTAVLLSLIILLFILLLILVDSFIRQKKRTANEKEDQVFTRLKFNRSWVLVLTCSFPVLFGFLIPVLQLAWWAFLAFDWDVWLGSFSHLKNTATLAAISGLLIVIFAIILTYADRITRQTKFQVFLSKLPMLGYALPGAVIGIGIVALIIWVNPNWIYTGIIAMIFGYTTRFFAVGYGPLDSGFKKIPSQLDDAAKTLGGNSISNLIQIHIPILKPALIAAFILVFVDVTKELPLTLILRPFNYETLATDAFQYAKDEMAPKSASSSLLIIFVSSLPVYFLNKLLNK